jgi:hypothetical protein
MDITVPDTVGSVTDLTPSLLHCLTGRPGHPPLPSWLADGPAPERLILMVVDGFGWDQLTRAREEGLMPRLVALMEAGRAAASPLATVFPSMTPVVLTSIVTGAFPSQHGIVGQTIRLPEGMVEVLHDDWPEGARPPVEVPDLATICGQHGIPYYVVLEHRLRHGPLTTILHGRTEHVATFMAASGLPVVLKQVLEQGLSGAVYVYWSALDTINHARGAYTPEWAAEVRAIDGWVGELAEQSPAGTWLWITADHGHVPLAHDLPYYTLREQMPWLPEVPAQCGNGIALTVAAEQRLPLAKAVRGLFAGRVSVEDITSLWAQGVWGPPGPGDYRDRLGNVLLWADRQGDYWHIRADHPTPRWSHGGLSPAEMRVPWIEIRLG